MCLYNYKEVIGLMKKKMLICVTLSCLILALSTQVGYASSIGVNNFTSEDEQSIRLNIDNIPNIIEIIK